MKFERDLFDDFALASGVVGFYEEPVTLKSGRTSNWYVNWREACNDAWRLDYLADFLIAYATEQGISTDCFFGVPEGATKLAIVASLKLAKESTKFRAGSHVVPMGRSVPKQHGKPEDKYFVGAPRGRVVVLEDVTTTGESLINTADHLLEQKIQVVAAIGLTNRNQLRDDEKTVEQVLAQRGIVYFSLTNAHRLLPSACKRKTPSDYIIDAVEREFAEYGIEPIKLR
jgi:orotate phosphoribosyltransferase